MREYITGGLCGAWAGVALPIIFFGKLEDIQTAAMPIAGLTIALMLDVFPRISDAAPKVKANAGSMVAGALLGLTMAGHITGNLPSVDFPEPAENIVQVAALENNSVA